jgi:hypothetical protein
VTHESAIPWRTRTWYVKPRGRRWSVQRQDAARAESLHDTREHAIARGIEIGQRAHGRLRVKALNGRVELELTFTDLPSA